MELWLPRGTDKRKSLLKENCHPKWENDFEASQVCLGIFLLRNFQYMA
jgi:hypothetical protein